MTGISERFFHWGNFSRWGKIWCRTYTGDTVLILSTFIFSRLTLEVVGWVARLRVPGGVPAQRFGLTDAPPSLDMWIRWDSQWFIEIARRGGYWFRHDGLAMPQAFFPLYPMLIRILTPLMGGRDYIAGLLISNLAFLGGLLALYHLVTERWGKGVAMRACSLLIIFPAGFYSSALYTEGLFFGFTAGAFYFAARDRWLAAGLCGMGAALTRNIGAVLLLPLAWEFVSRHGISTASLRRGVLWLGLVPAGIGLYMFFLHVTTGNALAFIEAENRWGRGIHAPWEGVAQAVSNVIQPPPPPPERSWVFHNAYRPPYRRLYSALDLSAVILFLGLLFLGWRMRVLPPSFLLFMGVALLIPLSAPALRSMTPLPSMWRYVSILFPGFITLSVLCEGRPVLERALWVIFPMLQGLFFLLFTTWNWIA